MGWKVRALSVAGAAVGLAAAGSAVGVVAHGVAGAGAGALGGVVAGFVPSIRDQARERRDREHKARQAWAASGEPSVARDQGSPAGLLRPDRGIVEFTGRAAVLSALRVWCQSGAAVSVRVLTGAGGTGKTRLALRLAAEWEAAGNLWRLVDAGAEGTVIEAARAVSSGPVLLVVDYAETRAGLEVFPLGWRRGCRTWPGPDLGSCAAGHGGCTGCTPQGRMDDWDRCSPIWSLSR